MKITVAATDFCQCDLSHKFKLLWICATCGSNKVSTSSLVAAAVQTRWLVVAIFRIVCLGLYILKYKELGIFENVRKHFWWIQYILYISMHFIKKIMLIALHFIAGIFIDMQPGTWGWMVKQNNIKVIKCENYDRNEMLWCPRNETVCHCGMINTPNFPIKENSETQRPIAIQGG